MCPRKSVVRCYITTVFYLRKFSCLKQLLLSSVLTVACKLIKEGNTEKWKKRDSNMYQNHISSF